VQPIVQANCARCHGPDPKQTQIAGFRLDRYVQGDDETQDAWDYREAIVDHAAAEGGRLANPPMPPDFPLSERQRAILRRWVENGAPKGTRDDAAPQIALESADQIPSSVDQSLDLAVRSWDGDGDGLWVQLYAREVGQVTEFPLGDRFGQGRRSATLDTGVLRSGRTYELFAALDDGFSDDPAQNRADVTLIPALLVDHGSKGAAPRVHLVEPNGGTTLLGDVTITWTASDQDPGDATSIDLDLFELGLDGSWVKTQTLGSGLPNGPQSVQWTPDVPDSTPTGAPILYKIRVTATDLAGNIRFDESDTSFTIPPPPRTTTFAWDDVRPIFARYCLDCHSDDPSIPPNDYFRLDKYDESDPVAPINTDLGVFDVKDKVYQRMFVERSMPPPARDQPTKAEKDKIQDWILGGAPKDHGPTDAPPAITWSTPNDTDVTPSTGGSITLLWTAVDPEGAPLTGTVSVVQLLAHNDSQAACRASLVGWAPLPGVNVADGTAVFTLPDCTPTPGNTCYWCFKADASDGNHTTTVAAAKPVR
jgi:hypothetical protein